MWHQRAPHFCPQLFGLSSPVDATGGRAPTLLTGHLFEGAPAVFLGLVALATAYLEANTLDNVEGLTPSGYVAGDLGFDPVRCWRSVRVCLNLRFMWLLSPHRAACSQLGLRGKREDMETAEIKHGRLAMLAVVGFSVQEAIYGTPIFHF